MSADARYLKRRPVAKGVGVGASAPRGVMVLIMPGAWVGPRPAFFSLPSGILDDLFDRADVVGTTRAARIRVPPSIRR